MNRALPAILKRLLPIVLSAAEPQSLLRSQLTRQADRLFINGQPVADLTQIQRVFVIGFGKAAAPMAAALEEILGDRLTAGAVIVKYDHVLALQRIRLFEAGHPVPDENSVRATAELLELCRAPGPDDLVFVLISGGGSALFEQPAAGLSLSDLQTMNRLMLGSGMNIVEMNAVRKQLSAVKGGRLAGYLQPARVIGLYLSDVAGDDFGHIASGPLVAAEISAAGVWDLLTSYSLVPDLPPAVAEYLQKSRAVSGKDELTAFKNVQNHLLGNNLRVLQAVADELNGLGFRTLILTDRLGGEARQTAAFFAGLTGSVYQNRIPGPAPLAVIAGGETTVTLIGSGRGGRNQEFVLAALSLLRNEKRPFLLFSIGTDGGDGPTDAAGAWIDQDSWPEVEKYGLDINRALRENDSYPFLEKIGALVKTGPTLTNVMDIIVLITG